LSTKYTFVIVQFFIICVSMIEESSLSLSPLSLSRLPLLSLATLFFVYKIHLCYSPIFYYLRIDDRRELSLSLTSFSISSPAALSLAALSISSHVLSPSLAALSSRFSLSSCLSRPFSLLTSLLASHIRLAA